MKPSIKVRRAAIRCAYVGLRLYWFVFRPRVVGVKCVVRHDDDVLLVRHTYGPAIWELPGGTVRRRREAPVDAARREMREELGRQIDDWQSLGQLFTADRNHHDDLHLFQASIGDPRLDIDLTELSRADWFRRDQLPPDVGRHVGEILARAAAANQS